MSCNLTEVSLQFAAVRFQVDAAAAVTADLTNCSNLGEHAPEAGGQWVLSVATALTILGAAWAPYGASLFIKRLWAWKAPLFQLIMQTPRPQVGSRWLEAFSMLHLLGDPFHAISSLMYTLDLAQRRVEYFMRGSLSRQHARRVALYVTGYEECGYGPLAAELETL